MGGISSAGTRICPVPGVGVAAAVGVGGCVAVGAGVCAAVGVDVCVATGVGFSFALKSLHPPIPATIITVPVTLRKSRRVNAATPSLDGASAEAVETTEAVHFSFLWFTAMPPSLDQQDLFSLARAEKSEQPSQNQFDKNVKCK